ncbi:hypothetical protein NQZ68_037029, partial [Dissostichus eleginoides]
VPEVVHAPGTAVLPGPAPESHCNGASGLGLKPKTALRSRAGSRLQNASRPGAGGGWGAERTVAAKQNQSKEQAEKKNQALSQLTRLLLQGNRRVEALATVIQHLFTEDQFSSSHFPAA